MNKNFNKKNTDMLFLCHLWKKSSEFLRVRGRW